MIHNNDNDNDDDVENAFFKANLVWHMRLN